MLILRKKRVGFPSVMNFEGQSGSESQEICDLFAKFMKGTYANDPWVPSDLGPDDVRDELPFGPLQFTVLEVLNALLDLDSNKGPSPDDVPSLILKTCTSAFSLRLCLLINSSRLWGVDGHVRSFSIRGQMHVDSSRYLISEVWLIGAISKYAT
jgi:hypothetical protein